MFLVKLRKPYHSRFSINFVQGPYYVDQKCGRAKCSEEQEWLIGLSISKYNFVWKTKVQGQEQSHRLQLHKKVKKVKKIEKFCQYFLDF